jgi:CubicO group peptidase (beta-lactamase class C family)
VKVLLAEPPGETGKYRYSNAGYVIVGAMLEAATGKSWESLIHERLFAPLGITSAGFGAPGAPGALDQPRGHNDKGRSIEPTPFADNPLAIGPAGTVHMTMGDWLKFAVLHIRGTRALEHPEDDHDLLGISHDNFKRIHTAVNVEPPYAYGWIVANSRLANINVLTHDGSNTLWYATVWVSPRLNTAIIVAANQGGDAAVHACHTAMEAIIKQRLESASRPDGGGL